MCMCMCIWMRSTVHCTVYCIVKRTDSGALLGAQLVARAGHEVCAELREHTQVAVLRRKLDALVDGRLEQLQLETAHMRHRTQIQVNHIITSHSL